MFRISPTTASDSADLRDSGDFLAARFFNCISPVIRVAVLPAVLLWAATAGADDPPASAADDPPSAAAENDATPTAETEAAPDAIMKMNEIEGISEYRLGNGTRILLFPDESKDVVTVNMTVFVGSRHEGYGEAGMAHLLEHMLFKGTPDHPNIPQVLNERGASFNGTTWTDRTNYYETLPAGDDNLEFAIRLEADRLVNSNILGEDLASEMTVVRNEFEAGENSPIQVLMQRIQSVAYDWHNYGQSTIGNRSDIERVPIVALREFYRKYYRPDNTMVIVAGKFDPENALDLLGKYFGALPRPDVPIDPTYTVEPPKDGERTVVLRRVGDVQYVGVAYHVPAASHPDFAAIRALVYILGDEPSGRLYKRLVETDLASNVFAFAPAFHDPGILMAFAEVPETASIEAARSELIEVMEESFAAAEVTEQETERAKQQILKKRELEAADSTRIAVSLSDWAAQGDWRLYFLFRDAVEELTPETVQQAAERFFVRNNRTVGLFIPTERPERVRIPESPNLAARLEDYIGREDIAVGEAFDVEPLAIERRTERGELFDDYRFALLPKKTRGNSVTVMLTLRFGDAESLKGRIGAAELVGAMMQRGTESKTYQEIEDELTRLRTDLSMNSTPGLLQIRVSTKREFLEEALDLVGEMLRKPRFEASELEVFRRQIITGLEGALNEPQALAPLAVRRALSPYDEDDVRYVRTLREELEMYRAVTIDEVREFYNDFIGAQEGELAAVGDFDPDAVKQQVKGFLTDWKPRKPYERFDRPAVTDVDGGVERISTPDKSNAMLYSSLQHKLDDGDPEYAAFDIATYIFGGGTLSSRLADRVRQQEGLSYGIRAGVSARPRDERTDFTLYAITNPMNVDRLLEVIREEIDKLRDDGVTEEELTRAKAAYLQSRRRDRAEDRSVASQLLASMFHRRTFEFTAEYEQRVADLSREEVNEAIREYLIPQRLVTAVAGDFETE